MGLRSANQISQKKRELKARVKSETKTDGDHHVAMNVTMRKVATAKRSTKKISKGRGVLVNSAMPKRKGRPPKNRAMMFSTLSFKSQGETPSLRRRGRKSKAFQ